MPSTIEVIKELAKALDEANVPIEERPATWGMSMEELRQHASEHCKLTMDDETINAILGGKAK